jgi:hypothetical protein
MRNDARVLRGYRAKSDLHPDVGCRYDGLYTVVSVNVVKIGNGDEEKRCRLFKLQRGAGQKDLKTLCKESPTERERVQFKRIRQVVIDVKAKGDAGWAVPRR